MNWLTDLIRPDLRALAAYRSARSEAGAFAPDIAVDANELPWPPFGATAAQCQPNRYPEPQPAALLARLAALWGVDGENMVIARGSDEGIDLLLRLFCQAGRDQILICPPTYGMYQIAAAIQGAEVLSVPLDGQGQLDVGAIVRACGARAKLIFIPSPNAPMGHAMRREDIVQLCRARLGQGLVVVDEAYVEFTDAPQGMLPDLPAHPNLVVLRTLSKAHALAGERVGCVIAAPEIVAALRKILAPYPLTQTSIAAALEALSANGIVQNTERRRVLVSERERMTRLLPQSPWVDRVFPSVANFVLVQTRDAAALMHQCRHYGILPRDRHSAVANTVRFSISTPEDNNLVLRALGVAVVETTPEAAMRLTPRLFGARRQTKETAIDITVNLDAPSFRAIDTGIGFFDHMLAQLAAHGGFGLEMHCKGDLEVDQHHSIEDCALALGEALRAALGDKRGITRFGFTAPLDESVAQAVIDLSGRPYCQFDGVLSAPMLGGMDSDMVPHFFYSLAMALGATLHITVRGENTHHMVEAVFKATGRALRQALRRDGSELPSTKGVL